MNVDMSRIVAPICDSELDYLFDRRKFTILNLIEMSKMIVSLVEDGEDGAAIEMISLFMRARIRFFEQGYIIGHNEGDDAEDLAHSAHNVLLLGDVYEATDIYAELGETIVSRRQKAREEARIERQIDEMRDKGAPK